MCSLFSRDIPLRTYLFGSKPHLLLALRQNSFLEFSRHSCQLKGLSFEKLQKAMNWNLNISQYYSQ